MFNRALANVLNKSIKKPIWRKPHNRWEICYDSKAFYTWYKQQELDTLKSFIEYNKDTVASFLRGLYDSDGNHYKYKGKYSRIWLYNNNIDLLYYVQYLLRKYFNIVATGPYLHIRAGEVSVQKHGKRIRANYDNYRVAIYRKQYVKAFLSEIGFSIRDKQLEM